MATYTYLWVDVTIGIISMAVYAPIALYYYIRFKQLDNLIVIKKRYPFLTLGLCKFVIIYLVVTIPLFSVMRPETWRLLFGDHTDIPRMVVHRVLHTVFPFSMFGIMTFTALRCWLMFFDLNWTMADRNSVWKYHLNPALIKSDFFLRHKETLGSMPFCLKIQLPTFVILSLIMTICFQISIDTESYLYVHTMNAVFLLIPSIFITVLWFKTRNCVNDNFFIRSEFKLISIIIAIEMCFYFGPMVMMMVTPTLFYFWDSVALFSSATAFFLISIASTYWVRAMVSCNIKQYYLSTNNSSNSRFKYDIGFLYGEFGEEMLRNQRVSDRVSSTTRSPTAPAAPTSIGHAPSGSHDPTADAVGKDIRLYHLMTNYDAFELFINHLAREFSTELMLCLITIIQWKHALCTVYHNNVTKDATHVALKSDHCQQGCILSHDIPGNDIVMRHFGAFTSLKEFESVDEFMGSAKQSAFDIYTKYIKEGSPLEVNISFELRSSLSGVCNTLVQNNAIDINDLFGMFDSVGEEQYKLMNFSFVRFKKTADWMKVVDVFSKHELIPSPCQA